MSDKFAASELGHNTRVTAMMIAGIDDDDDDGAVIAGEADFDKFLGAAAKSGSSKSMLSALSNVKVSPKAASALGEKARMLGRLSAISKQVLTQTGRIEAEYLRRPNTLVALYTPVLAAGASQAFSIQPGSGNSYYRVTGFICSDEQANIFGFQILKVGGEDHVKMTQTTPVAPVANVVPWSIFTLRESTLNSNLAPWTGQVFDNSTPITGTVVNMTVGGGDAIAASARIVILTQTDPCGFRYAQLQESSRGRWKDFRKNLGAWAPMIAYR